MNQLIRKQTQPSHGLKYIPQVAYLVTSYQSLGKVEDLPIFAKNVLLPREIALKQTRRESTTLNWMIRFPHYPSPIPATLKLLC